MLFGFNIEKTVSLIVFFDKKIIKKTTLKNFEKYFRVYYLCEKIRVSIFKGGGGGGGGGGGAINAREGAINERRDGDMEGRRDGEMISRRLKRNEVFSQRPSSRTGYSV